MRYSWMTFLWILCKVNLNRLRGRRYKHSLKGSHAGRRHDCRQYKECARELLLLSLSTSLIADAVSSIVTVQTFALKLTPLLIMLNLTGVEVSTWNAAGCVSLSQSAIANPSTKKDFPPTASASSPLDTLAFMQCSSCMPVTKKHQLQLQWVQNLLSIALRWASISLFHLEAVLNWIEVLGGNCI